MPFISTFEYTLCPIAELLPIWNSYKHISVFHKSVCTEYSVKGGKDELFSGMQRMEQWQQEYL